MHVRERGLGCFGEASLEWEKTSERGSQAERDQRFGTRREKAGEPMLAHVAKCSIA